MKGARRWAIAGLLCVCGVFGCAQLPSRSLFVRRTKPPDAESVADERFDSTDDEAANFSAEPDWNRDRQSKLSRDVSNDLARSAIAEGANSGPVSPVADSLATDSVSGSLDASDHRAGSAAVVAPPPSRRSSGSPAAFVAAPNARELQPSSIPNSVPAVIDRDGVVSAGYEAMPRGNASGIELVAGQRRETADGTGIKNPWDRFRGLTNNLDANEAATAQSHDSESLTNPRIESRRELSAGQPFAIQPRMDEASGSNAATNISSGSPGNWSTVPGTSSAAASSNLQWLNAEQPGANNFPPLAASNSQSPAPAGILPLNFGSPDGAPQAIVPFASSPELERLITQTTVEAAAVIPGDNDVSRQLYLRKQVQLRLLNLIAGQTDRALQPIPNIDAVDQEFWQQTLWGLANYFDTQGMPDSSERATQTIAQLRFAATRLQEKARLELRNVAFCHKISGFGNYQRFSRDQFTPGQPVLLYAEVADFKSEPTPDGQFRTLMKSTLEVLEGGPNGRLVESLPLTPSEDRCRNQRRDYYHSYEFAIPQGCNAGPHTLQLRVEDQLGKKTAVTRLNFSVQ